MALPTISVENFGPIRKGTVELRPLTIFTGHSNTGKSWFATLVYSLFSTRNFQTMWWVPERSEKKTDDKVNGLGKFPEDIDQWCLDSLVENEVKFSKLDHKILCHCLDRVISRILTDIGRCFGISSPEGLRRWDTEKEATIRVKTNDSGNKTCLFYKFCIFGEHFETNIATPTRLKFGKKSLIPDYIERIIDFRDNDILEKQQRARSRLLNLIVNLLYENKMGAHGSVFLPAGRVGLMESFNLFVPSKIEKILDNNEDDEVENLFPRNLSDFIATLAGVRPSILTSRHEAASERAKRVERNLLQGEILVKFNFDGQPYFYFRSFRGKKVIPLNRASSTVIQLAPLVIFLRYSINKNNLIVLEEPELDLHPEEQVKLIYELVTLVTEGYKILITTHSEWLTEALCNVIAYDGETELPKISSDDVGVWNFECRKNYAGSMINETEWSTDLGGYQTDFEAVSRRLYNEWVDATEDKT